MSKSIEVKERFAEILHELTELQPNFVVVITSFDEVVAKFENSESADVIYLADYWIAHAFRNALIKLRLILEQNFHFVETLGLLSTTRYIFEVLVWLRCLDHDPKYGLIFYSQVIDDQIQHTKNLLAKVESEIALFEEISKEEALQLDKHIQIISSSVSEDPKATADKFKQIQEFAMKESDRKARRSFCLYAYDAKSNGYGFQAHLLRTNVLETLQKKMDLLNVDRKALDSNLKENSHLRSKNGKVKKRMRWNWAEQANQVDMKEQYDFIYKNSSRMLHATPSSIFTDQKNLEPAEMLIYLEYIFVSMLDVLELSEKQLGAKHRLDS
jgi:hypothetical protein